jgi:trans-aconitate 2-methyltransferase
VTEWDARAYNRVSALQRWLAEKSLGSLVALDGAERVLDLGCGDGTITAEIARRVRRGSVLGVDASSAMVAFARERFPGTTHSNLSFQLGDVAQLDVGNRFDLVVSFNCLHWVRDQAAALRGIHAALAAAGRAHLRLVSQGSRRSLEDVIEDTRCTAAWAAYFRDYRPPYVHLTPDAYRALAERCGLRTERLDVQQEAWDFGSRGEFVHFAEATFVEWTRCIAAPRHGAFINDVLDRYRQVGDGASSQANVFTFYQMEIVLRRA